MSSIIFGICHTELGIVGAVIFGIANCILYVKYKNVLIPMSVHFLNNATAAILLIFDNSSNETTNMSESEMVTFGLVGVILLGIGTHLFIKFIKHNKIYLK